MEAQWKCTKVWAKNIAFPKTSQRTLLNLKDLTAVVKDIKFRNARSFFKATLQEDIRLIYN